MKTFGKILLVVTAVASLVCLLYQLIDTLYESHGKRYLNYDRFDKM